jgi:hypothetical protein
MRRATRLLELMRSIEKATVPATDEEWSRDPEAARLHHLQEMQGELSRRIYISRANLRAARRNLLLLEDALARVETEIGKTLKRGNRSGRRTGPPGKGVDGETLGEAALAVLRATRRAMTLTELSTRILDWGYRTESEFVNFRTNVAHALRRLGGQVIRAGRRWKCGPSVKRTVAAEGTRA